MHFPIQTLSLLGALTLTLAEQNMDLGYLKCASALVESTSFPSCTSSQKLECFCEAQAKESQDSAAHVQLAPEVEELCAENGVPKDEIARYLCDDDAVPASPRRGSKPMVRLEQQPQQQTERRLEDERIDTDMASTKTEKRAMQPDSTRLLIPENEQVTGTESEAAAQKPETHSDADAENDDDDKEDRAGDSEVVEIVTVTETHCFCAETAGATPVFDPTSGAETHGMTSGDTHGTEVASSSSVTGPTSAASSVRVASSSVVETSPVPTGVDAEGKHSPKEDEGENGEMFEGGAVMYGASKYAVVVALGVVAGIILL